MRGVAIVFIRVAVSPNARTTLQRKQELYVADFQQLQKYEFLSLETFRKNGVGLKSPLWFAQEGDTLYFWTVGNSGKVKRIRNNPQVKIAPCKRFGEIIGPWIAAHATVDDSAAAVEHVEVLLVRKLGFIFRVFRLIDNIRDRQKGASRVCIKVTLPKESDVTIAT